VTDENVDECLEIGHTSSSQKLQKFVVAVMRLHNVDKMFSLSPGDTADLRTSKLSQKRIIGVDVIQQLNTIDSQFAHPSFVQRTNVTVMSW